MDKVSPRVRSFIMSRIRSRDTAMEVLFARVLRRSRVSFRQHANLLGKPDFVFRKAKTVVFLDSCFWHRCPYHYRHPQSRPEYWGPKIENNVKRDKKIRSEYRRCGWKVFRFWEHQIQKDIFGCAEIVVETLRSRLAAGIIAAPAPSKPQARSPKIRVSRSERKVR
jgi:DNA mismatch endonuclease, patch repair protein